MNSRVSSSVLIASALLVILSASACGDPPAASYIFPAGGQRGTKVTFRVGGMFLHDKANFEMLGPGVAPSPEVKLTETTWFEGPLIRQPASQAAEDYPKDYLGEVQIAADAAAGARLWRVWNAQGITPLARFVVGDLPEVVEEETDGEPMPVQVALPVTVNGRIFPREDVDVWMFEAPAGQSITCVAAAAEFGSPLKPRLEVRGPDGKPLAETTGSSAGDLQLRFTAAATGKHEVRIHDVQFGGLQNYVYRLTVTSGPWIDRVYPLGGKRGSDVRLEVRGQGLTELTAKAPDGPPGIVLHRFETSGRSQSGIRFDVDELAEHLESEPNDAAAGPVAAQFPGVLNGRIDKPGDVDLWQIGLAKGLAIRIESRSARLGSPIAALLVLRDEMGKELARADALDSGNGDPGLDFTAPADGKYTLEVSERFKQRGGPAFAYRVRLAPPPAPDFELLVPDSVVVDADGTKNLEVTVVRTGSFKGPITLHLDGLPAGFTAEDVKLPDGAPKGVLVIKAEKNPPALTTKLKVTGKAEVDGKSIERVGHVAARAGESGLEEIRLVTALQTPFKFTGTYDFRYIARGTVLKKKYQIDRGGFEGPLEARLADRQGRHLQGVTGPVVVIPPGVNEFEYPLALPPWMELARTSRTNIMLTGEVKDSAGAVHKVCFKSGEQNEQLVALVSPGLLRLATDRSSYTAAPGAELVVAVETKRDRSLISAIHVALVVPRHMRDISAEPITIPAGSNTGELRIKFGPSPGPLNMPLTLRAVGKRNDEQIVGESLLTLVREEAFSQGK